MAMNNLLLNYIINSLLRKDYIKSLNFHLFPPVISLETKAYISIYIRAKDKIKKTVNTKEQ